MGEESLEVPGEVGRRPSSFFGDDRPAEEVVCRKCGSADLGFWRALGRIVVDCSVIYPPVVKCDRCGADCGVVYLPEYGEEGGEVKDER